MSAHRPAANQLRTALAQQQLDEIAVTATRREETTQDIPIAISGPGGQQLKGLNITDMQDCIEMLPNVNDVTLARAAT